MVTVNKPLKRTILDIDPALYTRLRVTGLAKGTPVYKIIDVMLRLGLLVFAELETFDVHEISNEELIAVVNRIAKRDAIKQLISERKITLENIRGSLVKKVEQALVEKD